MEIKISKRFIVDLSFDEARILLHGLQLVRDQSAKHGGLADEMYWGFYRAMYEQKEERQ